MTALDAQNQVAYISNWPTATEIAEYLGGRNWVVARRTPRIVRKYGADVICISQAKYSKMHRELLAAREH